MDLVDNLTQRSPCMKDNKFAKFFPKRFKEETYVYENGYPCYKIRDSEATVVKGEIMLNNRYMVPHNPTLLLKYNAHINVKWCNQSQAFKYKI